jgi:hypothetical protein
MRKVLVTAAAFILLSALPLFAQSVSNPYDTPVLSDCSSDETSITLTVTAGTSGAPNGFSLQWMTKEDNDAYGWSLYDGEGGTTSYCAASFSGSARNSRFNLAGGESVSVTVPLPAGNDPGASGGCGNLECGTEYVFRVFAHGDRNRNRSLFSEAFSCSTDPCLTSCSYSQGYWKNHPEAWVGVELTLGDNSYTQSELLSILDQSVQGNGAISLAKQLIASKLNDMTVDDPALDLLIAAADSILSDQLGSEKIPPVGDGFIHPDVTSDTTDALAAYIAANHCDDDEGDEE